MADIQTILGTDIAKDALLTKVNQSLASLNLKKIEKYIGKTSAPTVNDDNTEGYTIGDIWIDETNDKAYICLDITTGSAVWVDITQTGGGGGGGYINTIQIAGTQIVNDVLFEGGMPATTLSEALLSLPTAPTGSNFIITYSKSTDQGSTYPTSETVTLTAGNKFVNGSLTLVFAEGDFMKIEITQVGSTVAGQNLTLTTKGS